MRCVFRLFSILFLLSTQLVAQQSNPTQQPEIPGCFTDELLKIKRLNNPSFQARVSIMNTRIGQKINSGIQRDILTIPVVVHVIHENGLENISDFQIHQGIADLNAAFANEGAYFNPNGVNTNIQFCLAVRGPAGEFTNGITRNQSALTNVTTETQDADLKNLVRWDPNKYLNIWLVNEITSLSMGTGIAGYAYFPTSQGQSEDGIVNEARFFGSTTDNSKVHIHEAGHYLGLYHTFEGSCANTNCQTDGDRVCDTPPDNSTQPIVCGGTVNTCTSDDDDLSANNPFRPVVNGGVGDQPDMYQNYMDYGYQSCQFKFSSGQSDRMNAALTTERAILLESDGCITPCLNQFVITDFSSDATEITAGDSIHFTGATTFQVNVEWQINSNAVASSNNFAWQFNQPGTYTVTLTAYSNDPTCTQVRSMNIRVNCAARAFFDLNTTGSYFTPGVPVTASNTSINGISYSWHLDGNVLSSGFNWQQTFNTPGGHSLYLITTGATCSDTSSTKFFQVGNCDLSGVTRNWEIYKNRFTFQTDGQLIHASSNAIMPDGVESSSTISDADGNLLFFSDGLSVWDRNENLMPNGTGLLGHYSSTQGSIIVPHPGNSHQYFVFTSDAFENDFTVGLHYSIVDMQLNGGLGDVTETKNVLLLTGTNEKLSATWHANGHDIWIGTGAGHSNAWYAFLIDDAGVHATPVVSNIGTAPQVAIGAMKFSHDGNRIAACMLTEWPWRVMLADFDKSTGVYSNPTELILSSEFNEQVFGLEFSPDNSKLYVSVIIGGNIFQYDLSYTTAAQIQASRVTIDPYEFINFGHLLLAPDGKIYINAGGQLDAIPNPNLAGLACGYQSNVVTLPPPQIYTSLPNMLQGFFSAHEPSIAGPLNMCKGGLPYTFGITFESAEDSSIWSHSGSGTLQATNGNNTATIISSNNTGTDTLRVTVYGRCGITRDTIIIHTNSPEITVLPETGFACDTNLILNPGNDFLSYYWQDGANTPIYSVSEAGLYWVRVKGASGCIINDTTEVFVAPLIAQPDLGPDRNVCQFETVVLNATDASYTQYEWQDGSQNPTYTAFQTGTYWVTGSDGCTSSTDTIHITEASAPPLNLNYQGNDTLCKNALPFSLSAPGGFSSYAWSNGSNAQSINVNAIGAYSLVATTASGCTANDTVWVIDCITSVDDITTSPYSFFPNPADQLLQISSRSAKTITIKLWTLSGQLVQERSLLAFETLQLSTATLANELYLLEFISPQRTWQEKLMILHP